VEVTQVGGLVQVIGPAILAPAVGQCCAGAEVTVRHIDAEVTTARFQAVAA
jgi:hypothetical protein